MHHFTVTYLFIALKCFYFTHRYLCSLSRPFLDKGRPSVPPSPSARKWTVGYSTMRSQIHYILYYEQIWLNKSGKLSRLRLWKQLVALTPNPGWPFGRLVYRDTLSSRQRTTALQPFCIFTDISWAGWSANFKLLTQTLPSFTGNPYNIVADV